MENEKKEFDFLEFHQKLSPTIIELDWPKTLGIDLHDFEVNFSVEGSECTGRGSSALNRDKAMLIASAEGIERAAVFFNRISNTNGVASHTSFIEAQFNAVKELYERHAFLLQFYTGKLRGRPLPLTFKDAWKNLSNNEVSSSKNYHIANGKIEGTHIVIVANIVKVRSGEHLDGFIIGLGCNADSEEACKSAEIENLRFVAHLLENRGIKPLTIEQFNSISNPSFEDHGLLALDSNYSRSINSIFDFEECNPTFVKLDYSVKKLPLPPQLSDSLFVAHATSNDSLPLFTGYPTDNFKKTFYQVSSSELKFNIPHPLA